MDKNNTASIPQDGNPRQSVLLFDGACHLCNRWVRIVIDRDKNNRFCFAPLQSDAGKRILAQNRLPEDYLNSIVLWENNHCHFKSAAIFKTLRKMDGLWPLLSVFAVIPAPLLDFIYGWIAARRYGWFGKADACIVPSAEIKSRFLE